MIKAIALQVIFYALLLAAWQGLYFLCVPVLELWKPYAFPNPIGVGKSLYTLIEQNMLFVAVFYSLKRAIIGYFMSIGAGIVLGFFLVKFKILVSTVKPLILGIQTLPSICWVPFAILWFGLNESAIIFVIVMGSTFSIAISVDMAIRNVNPLYIKAAKTMGAKGFSLYAKVICPASLPSLITGLKQGWSFAWRSLMAGEVMSASIGLGQALTMGRDLADINRVMLIIMIIVILGVLIERLVFSIMEERILKKLGY
jgi:NitT/TauT family transport system permease protein